MKTLTMLQIVIVSVFFSVTVWAQTIVNVSPGIGTLNDAIGQNGAATYVLQAGQWYGLSGTIQVTNPISIVGETPKAGQMPAIVQNGSTSAGATFPFMFIATADLTLKNVFFVNSDLNEGLGSGMIYQAASGRIIMDSITVDPVGVNFLLFANAQHVTTIVTNSLFMRQGNTLSINDGGVFWNQGGRWDSLYVENNTFVDIGTAWMLGAGQPNGDAELFHWINHNSFLFGKAHLYLLSYPDAMFFTNNLCWMMDTYLFKPGGTDTWDPGTANKYQAFFDSDTLVVDTVNGVPQSEVLPCKRKEFVAYNSNYRTKAIWDLIAWDLAKGNVSYLKPFVFPASYIDSCRATRIFNDKTNFPYFKTGNNIEDLGAEIPANNPNFVEQKIYKYTDSAAAWAEIDLKFIRGITGLPASSDWPNYFYNVDGNQGNPTTWPRFNGAYTNSTLLTASIEKLPLGDLNWFPDKKAIWQKHQAEVMQHIMGENLSQINISGIKAVDNHIPAAYQLAQNYPNPFNPTTTIYYSVAKQGAVTLKVFNLIGQEVATLVNRDQNAGNYSVDFNAANLSSGVYIYRLESGDFVATKKLTLLK